MLLAASVEPPEQNLHRDPGLHQHALLLHLLDSTNTKIQNPKNNTRINEMTSKRERKDRNKGARCPCHQKKKRRRIVPGFFRGVSLDTSGVSVHFRHSFGCFLHIATILLSVRKEYGQTKETSGSSADTEISTEMDG